SCRLGSRHSLVFHLCFFLVFFCLLCLSSLFSFFFFFCYGVLRDLHSFPTRRSSDLTRNARAGGNETSSAGTGNRARITPTTPAICRRTSTADHRQYACALNAAWAVYDRS